MQTLARVVLCAFVLLWQANPALHAQRGKIIVPTPPPKKPVYEFPVRYVGGFTQESRSQLGRDTETVTIKGTNMTWRPAPVDELPSGSDQAAINQAIQQAGGTSLGDVFKKWGVDAARRNAEIYVPNGDGQMTITVDGVVPGSGNNAGSCTYRGSKTYDIATLPRGALKYFVLMVGANGRYWLNLAMVGDYLSADYTFTCTKRQITPRGDKKYVAIELALGFEGGIVMGVNGGPPPRHSGPATITGSWAFGGLDR